MMVANFSSADPLRCVVIRSSTNGRGSLRQTSPTPPSTTNYVGVQKKRGAHHDTLEDIRVGAVKTARGTPELVAEVMTPTQLLYRLIMGDLVLR